jgi:hypothetical protein
MNPNEKEIDIEALVELLDNQMSKGTGHINVFQSANSDNPAADGCPCMACQVPTLLDIADENK